MIVLLNCLLRALVIYLCYFRAYSTLCKKKRMTNSDYGGLHFNLVFPELSQSRSSQCNAFKNWREINIEINLKLPNSLNYRLK